MKDFVVEVLYQDITDNTQQELFEVSATTSAKAEAAVVKMLKSEGASITYIKTK